MAYLNPNIPTVDILEQDPTTGLISRGTSKGVPPSGAAYAGIFSLQCELIDIDGSGIYQQSGSVAVPAWTALAGGGGAGITELIGDVTAGPGTGQQTATIANNAITTGKIANGTILNVDVNAAAAIALTKLAPLASANVLLGNAFNVATATPLTGDVAITAAGLTSVSGINGFVVDTSGVQNTSQDRIAKVTPLGAPQALTGAGALALTSYQTRFTSNATGNALTLANGTMGGQVKKVTYVAEGINTDTGVITAATGLFTSVTLTEIGGYAEFLWIPATGWQCIDFVGATVV